VVIASCIHKTRVGWKQPYPAEVVEDGVQHGDSVGDLGHDGACGALLLPHVVDCIEHLDGLSLLRLIYNQIYDVMVAQWKSCYKGDRVAIVTYIYYYYNNKNNYTTIAISYYVCTSNYLCECATWFGEQVPPFYM